MRRGEMKLGDGGRKGDNGEDMRWMKTHRGWWGNGCGGKGGRVKRERSDIRRKRGTRGGDSSEIGH